MMGQSQIHVYIVAGEWLSPRLRERFQAEVQSALKAVPERAFMLLRSRLTTLGLSHFPFIVEPCAERGADSRVLSLGRLGDRPAVYLRPVLQGDGVDWRQERRWVVAKALAYLCLPDREEDPDFWRRWALAAEEDRLAESAVGIDRRWAEASPVDLLLEMFAAWALSPGHRRWQDWPAVRRFLEDWQAAAMIPGQSS
jgi:hypothetical protein